KMFLVTPCLEIALRHVAAYLRVLPLTPLLRNFSLVTVALLGCAALRAADIPPASPISFTGTPAVTENWRDALLASGPKAKTFGTVEAVESTDTVKLITTEQPPLVFNLQTILLNKIPLRTGDTLFIRFAARSLKADLATGVTKIRIGFSKNSEPWSGSYNGELGLGSDWQRFDIPFTCKNDFLPNEAKLSFMFGYPAQQAEIADVQLIRYDASVLPGDLPKTRRFADPVSAKDLRAALTRISSLRSRLDSVKDPSPAKGRTLHVAVAGSAGGDGSPSKPFADIQQAITLAQPGDTVFVAAGRYDTGRGLSFRKSGRADAWIKLKAAPGARPKLVASGWSGIDIRGGIGYIEINGLELEWIADPAATEAVHGAGIAPMYATHHIRALNNVVHGFGTGGIVTLDCDYIHIEGNVIYNTSKTSPYGGSAISLCRAFDFDEDTGYRNIVRGNIIYDNELQVVTQLSSGGNGRTLTDGNGIIIDVFNKSRANPLKPHGQDKGGPLDPYYGRTLVENNLIYDNGGRGIHVFRSSHVDVVNNTTYMNQKSADINGGEFTAIESSHVVFLNNIAYGRKEKRGNTQDGSTYVIWHRNLFFNVADVLVHDGIIEADPLFVAPALDAKPEGFRLQPGSPARGVGLPQPAPAADITLARRPAKGPVDLGAFQSSR
ncbi:MAG: DUF1565 domain-containing protein, partial [Opitutaceae bacterium]|nr:DUF1565 domain-containing protein [Opitutaceae bacterium]